jgi:hypothetical protein
MARCMHLAVWFVILCSLCVQADGVKRKHLLTDLGPGFARRTSRKTKTFQESQAQPGTKSSSSQLTDAGGSSSSITMPRLSGSTFTSSSHTPSAKQLAGSQKCEPSEFRSSKDVLADMFLSNKLSAKDISDLAVSNFKEGNQQLNAIAKAGAWGNAPKNLARDLMRQFLKGCVCPEPFFWNIPLWDVDTNSQVSVPFPFMLPHEVLHFLVEANGISNWAMDKALYPDIHKQVAEQCLKHGLDMANTIAIGIHGDGVPFTKRDSLELLSFNFLSHPTADRVPFTGISKKHLCQCGCKGFHTWHAILSVFKWSLLMLLAGRVSGFLPDNSLWVAERNRLLPTTKLCCHALLMQCRGDWPFLRTLFNFPSWSSNAICWLCQANRSTHPFTDPSLGAAWRNARYAAHEALRLLNCVRPMELCPLLALPAFTISCVVLDWLHVVDLGVGADVLGCFFWELIARPGLLQGATQACRVKTLFSVIKAWYKINKPASCLSDLTLTMIKGPKANSKPKLRCKGGECRYLIPFACEYSASFINIDRHWRMVHDMFALLFSLQKAVSDADYEAAAASSLCRRFCILYAALGAAAVAQNTPSLWQFKPKVHLLEEMVEYQSFQHGSPKHFWCYRDESWCGWWAKASKRRGGANLAASTALRLLTRFRAFCNSS